MPHVLRADANPHDAYIDGRISDLFDIIEVMSIHLRSFTELRWKQINVAILDIFKSGDSARTAEYEAVLEKLKEGQ